MIVVRRRAMRLNRPLPRTSVTKKSRRHGAAKMFVSRRWISSTSSSVGMANVTSSMTLAASQPGLGLGQADVDRRDVAVALSLAARFDGRGATGARQRHVAVLQKVADAEHLAGRRRAEVRRL